MPEIVHVSPPGVFRRMIDGRPLYSTLTVIKSAEGARLILAGQVSAREDGQVVGKGDMTAQIRQVCENIGRALRHAGADFKDLVRTVTYTVDVPEYFRCAGVRAEYFGSPPPPSTLLGVTRLADPDFLVEIEGEAVIPLGRLRNA
ncbi:MAG: RidA family protein [Candidatus Tectomicrobia bacterium]|uniref:RidA family protein n=1 Tax=Tectimicrobiota bacterium TaxID=2528274 RepID=A0A932MNB9_UNCTE|nr:RidA family protein [Candidatus Tectomicrobia bacterium]